MNKAVYKFHETDLATLFLTYDTIIRTVYLNVLGRVPQTV